MQWNGKKHFYVSVSKACYSLIRMTTVLCRKAKSINGLGKTVITK